MGALGPEHQHYAREGIRAQRLGGQCRQTVCALAEVDGLRCQQDPRTGRRRHHAADARIARSTVVTSSASVPGAMRITAPASRTSINDAARVGEVATSGTGFGASATIGIKAGSSAGPAASDGSTRWPAWVVSPRVV